MIRIKALAKRLALLWAMVLVAHPIAYDLSQFLPGQGAAVHVPAGHDTGGNPFTYAWVLPVQLIATFAYYGLTAVAGFLLSSAIALILIRFRVKVDQQRPLWFCLIGLALGTGLGLDDGLAHNMEFP